MLSRIRVEMVMGVLNKRVVFASYLSLLINLLEYVDVGVVL
jgi:hypothetical protein